MSTFIYVATVAAGDDHRDPSTDVVGVFSTEEAAWAAARGAGPQTAAVERYELDVGGSEVVRWMQDGEEHARVPVSHPGATEHESGGAA